MSSRNIGFILIVIGVIVVLAFVLADAFSMGGAPNRFGPMQIVGVVVGVVLIIVGVMRFRRPAGGPPPA
jgi:hypothetical protein